MTALSLELMDITRDWVSSFVMLCQAFTLADFSCCLFVGLYALVLSSASEMQLNRVWNQEIDLAWSNCWVAFAVCFGSSSICTMKRSWISFAEFDWIWAESLSLYTSEFIRLLLSSVTSSINSSNPEPLEAMLMPSHRSTVFHRWCCMLWSWAVPSLLILFSSRHSGTGSS